MDLEQENGEELSSGLWLYRPGELVPPLPKSRRIEFLGPPPGRGPLDSPPLPRRQVGCRVIAVQSPFGGRGA